MKKLTAGILTVMLGIVAANSADASIASRGYVDAQVGTKVATSDFNTFKTENTEAIADAKKAGTAAKDALDAYQASNDAAVAKKADAENVTAELAKKQNKLTAGTNIAIAEDGTISTVGIATTEGLEALETTVEGHTTKLDKLTGNGEGSVAKSIADALTNYTTTENMNDALDLKADKTTVSAMDTAYKAADTAINTKIGTVPEGTNVVTMIEEAKSAASTGTSELAGRVDTIEQSAAYKSGITTEKVAQIETNKTEVAKVAKDLADNYTKTSELGKLAMAAPGECAEPTKKCALVFDGTKYAWEVIERDAENK